MKTVPAKLEVAKKAEKNLPWVKKEQKFQPNFGSIKQIRLPGARHRG